MLVSYLTLARALRRRILQVRLIMVILIYTADDSVGEAAPSPISPEPSCRKGTIRGGRVLDGGDACHVSTPRGRRRASASRARARRASPGRTCRRGRRASNSAPPPPPRRAVRSGLLTSFRCAIDLRPRSFLAAHHRKSKRARVLGEREGELTETATRSGPQAYSNLIFEYSGTVAFRSALSSFADLAVKSDVLIRYHVQNSRFLGRPD